MNAKILEIFQSIQGEGKYAGVKQVFVRFFECNMHCVWCDTPHSIGDTSHRFDEYSKENVLNKVSELWEDSHSVSLTGGEPLMQAAFIKEILPDFKKAKRSVHLETNGIFYNELQTLIDDIDVVAMDIKLPSSTQCDPYWNEHKEFLNIAKQKDVFVKTVISSNTDTNDVMQSIDIVAQVDPNILFILQPNSFELQNGVMKRCLEFHQECTKRLNNVRVIPQMHRFMKIR